MTALCLLWAAWWNPEAVTDAKKAALYPVLQEAYRLFEAKRFEAAAGVFEQAYAISPEPRFVLNLALSLRGAKKCRPALAAFDRFFRICVDCEQRAAAQPLEAEARQACEAPVRIETTPSGAMLAVNGEPRGPSPLELRLLAGPHVVRASIAGHLAVERPLLLRGGEPATLELTLAPEPPPAVVIEAPPPTPPPTDLDPWIWTAFGVSAVGAVAGTTFGLFLLDDLDNESSAKTREAANAAQDVAKRDAILAQVGLGVALLGAAAGVTLLVLDEDAEVALGMTPSGLGLGGRF